VQHHQWLAATQTAIKVIIQYLAHLPQLVAVMVQVFSKPVALVVQVVALVITQMDKLVAQELRAKDLLVVMVAAVVVVVQALLAQTEQELQMVLPAVLAQTHIQLGYLQLV
jgi:hypothetical protein